MHPSVSQARAAAASRLPVRVSKYACADVTACVQRDELAHGESALLAGGLV